MAAVQNSVPRNRLAFASVLRYLALVSALATEADYVFVPESPPPDDWPNDLCERLKQPLSQMDGFISTSAMRFSVDMIRQSPCQNDELQVATRSGSVDNMSSAVNLCMFPPPKPQNANRFSADKTRAKFCRRSLRQAGT
ncbi:hypothetical protein NQ317_019718 [Molorchus minor]|uniref:Secreted protein n=1 Tax=Molorchus minor TaxID=1323400 RepID=A0ABQ9JRZ0_9CUCU|nr:hypothetical protein NQ317_019718 [Molorchus minor]